MAVMQAHDPGFVRFADVGDLATAQVAAAVLAAAGIETRIHGESLGPYPVTIGQLAVTQIWIRPDDLEDARIVMLEAEIDHALGPEVRGGAVADPGSLPMRIAALTMAGLLLYAVVSRLMQVF
jgi:hypothetical protein